MLESMNNNLDLMPSCFEDAVLENWNLAHPTVRPPQRDTVYVNLDKYSFEHLAKNEFRCPHKLRIYARRFIVASGTKSALLIIGVRIRPSDVKSGEF